MGGGEAVGQPHIAAEALEVVRLADGLALHVLHAIVCAVHARIGGRGVGRPFAAVFLDHSARVVDVVGMLIIYAIDIERRHAWVPGVGQDAGTVEDAGQDAEAEGVVVGTQHRLVHMPVVGDALVGGGEFPERLSGGIARVAALGHGHHRLGREVPAARYHVVIPQLHAHGVGRQALVERHPVLADTQP